VVQTGRISDEIDQANLWQKAANPKSSWIFSRQCSKSTVDSWKLEPVINFRVGRAGSQFFRVQGTRSDADRVSSSDE
jgi:hypothetical protein